MGKKNRPPTRQKAIAPAPRTTPGAPGGGLRGGKLLAIVAATFALAFGLAWFLFTPGAAVQPQTPDPAAVRTAPTVVLAAADVAPFLSAVTAEDYSAMDRLGTQLFTSGAAIPDHANLFDGYAVNSYPSYHVYNFYSQTTGEQIYRVLLTVEDNGAIESFLAEEMPIVK